MGTEQTTLQLQGEIKRLIQQLGKSQNEAARFIYTETYEFDDDDEIKRFEGRFKKQLQRKTTKPEFLQGYLNILTSWYESKGCNKKQLGAIKPKKISAFIAAEMRKLSEELDFYNE
ncbi:MAG: hypothetical protein CL584_00160 [Alteromonadaceae bacterium]|uniref:hypothetical protein n=1 Tax=Alteromonas mediterranea TaxID=314275 RepID=UPI000C4E3024|nr:hypothetical protein [Alteromonadaceae bacterium]|tara:strand:- start:130 stop:477 length:348 start_codon:yes stop_codon:yes gene_type:complete